MIQKLAIEVRGLRKSYGDHLVLDCIDLAVREGTVFALIGPNGSGKTTTVWILSTLLAPDAGTVLVAGHSLAGDPAGLRRAIGVTGQFSAVDNLLTGQENLELMADLAHLPRATGRRRVPELLARFELLDAARKPVMTYSGGMRRRLDLAMTLVGDPRVIFLDEPTTGLDPRSRRTMWQIVRELSAAGVTVFLTTQYLEEADQLADHVALLDGGRLVAQGTPSQLKAVVPGAHIEVRLADPAGRDVAIRLLGLRSPGCDDLLLRAPTDGTVGALRALLARLEDSRVPVESVQVRSADLDDVFFALTGGGGNHPPAPYTEKVHHEVVR